LYVFKVAVEFRLLRDELRILGSGHMVERNRGVGISRFQVQQIREMHTRNSPQACANLDPAFTLRAAGLIMRNFAGRFPSWSSIVAQQSPIFIPARSNGARPKSRSPFVLGTSGDRCGISHSEQLPTASRRRREHLCWQLPEIELIELPLKGSNVLFFNNDRWLGLGWSAPWALGEGPSATADSLQE